MGESWTIRHGNRKNLAFRNIISFKPAFLVLSFILMMGFSFGEIPDLEILPPVCGVPSSKHAVFHQADKNNFEILDTKTGMIKTVKIPVKSTERSPLWSYDDYVFFWTEKTTNRYDVKKEKFEKFPHIHGTVYFNYDTNILIRNLYNFEPNTVQLQKEKYNPEKKTYTILKTWPKFINSEVYGGKILIITNREETILIDVESGFEKSLKGRLIYFFSNDRQYFVGTRGVLDGMHLYQIDLAFRGRTIDYAIAANSEILKEFTTGWYRSVGINKKTGYLYSAFTNRGDNSLESTTLENQKFVKRVYTLPKELPYKFIYEKEKNNFMEGEFYSMYGDLAVFYFRMDNDIRDTRFIFLDTKKYDQLPENDKKDSIVFEFKNESWLHWVYFHNDKFYITTDTRIYCYDYDYNLLWKKLCPKYFGEVKYGNNTFLYYNIFNNDTLLFDVYAKEYDEDGSFIHNYNISPCSYYGDSEKCSDFIPTKHGIFSIYCDTEGIQLARIRLFKPDVYAPAYDLTSKNKIVRYDSWDYDGEDLITLERTSSDKKLTEVFNIKLGQFVE